MAKADQLTDKQAAFCRAYLTNGRNASAAYRQAYAPQKMSDKAIGVEACRLLGSPKVSLAIGRANEKAAAVTEAAVDRYAVSKARIVRELARMAFADSRKLFEWTEHGVKVRPSADLTDDEAAAVVEVSETRTAEGGTIRVKLGDKRAALVNLTELLGYQAPKVVRMIRDWADLSDEEVAALAGEGAVAAEKEDGTRH